MTSVSQVTIAEYASKVTRLGCLKCVGCGIEGELVVLRLVTDDPLGPVVAVCSAVECQLESQRCQQAWLTQAQMYPCVAQTVLVQRTVPQGDPYEEFTVTQIVYSMRAKRYLVKVCKCDGDQMLHKHVEVSQLLELNPGTEIVLKKNEFITQQLAQGIHPRVTAESSAHMENLEAGHPSQ